jgi:hypothetical protein
VKAFRSIKIGRIIASTSLQIKESTMELDTHADTTVLGKSVLYLPSCLIISLPSIDFVTYQMYGIIRELITAFITETTDLFDYATEVAVVGGIIPTSLDSPK